MPNYEISQRWEDSSEFKRPFNYALGRGKLTDEEAETYEGKGQLCLLQRVDMGDLIKLGIAEELDFMSKELMTSPDAKQDDTSPEAVRKAFFKAESFGNMDKMLYLVCHAGILAPKLHLPPMITEIDKTNKKEITRINENARQKGLVYIDQLPFDDRFEIFSQVFESGGLSSFREEQETGVGNVEHESGLQMPADRPVDLRPENAEGILL